ncbi:hypothetical protein [Parasphingorhabdus cellanae]|uniref:Uncharacterized protein n=1 Tax=Parasphingorhabdus cellanae TaxID=2806553 RepID=A0ABX7T797_9SPHN|nr:hypothetical protein [Parasphingorhabdus cellanae]QTD56735.1 hypothetical protein J4G78_03920 [Parasphingorhabdus cellanae]
MKKLMIPMIALTLAAAAAPAHAKSASDDFSWDQVRYYIGLLLPAVQKAR